MDFNQLTYHFQMSKFFNSDVLQHIFDARKFNME